MSDEKWTPGPWTWDGAQVISIRSGRQVNIARAYLGDQISVADREANARLIAAAPCMAEALSDFLENPAFQVGVGGNPIAAEKMIERARLALSKARGET